LAAEALAAAELVVAAGTAVAEAGHAGPRVVAGGGHYAADNATADHQAEDAHGDQLRRPVADEPAETTRLSGTHRLRRTPRHGSRRLLTLRRHRTRNGLARRGNSTRSALPLGRHRTGNGLRLRSALLLILRRDLRLFTHTRPDARLTGTRRLPGPGLRRRPGTGGGTGTGTGGRQSGRAQFGGLGGTRLLDRVRGGRLVARGRSAVIG
jgi:hypothetical protein